MNFKFNKKVLASKSFGHYFVGSHPQRVVKPGWRNPVPKEAWSQSSGKQMVPVRKRPKIQISLDTPQKMRRNNSINRSMWRARNQN